MNECYITIEDIMLTGYLEECIPVIEEQYGDECYAVSNTERHLTLRYKGEDFGDAKDLCAFITSCLLELGILQFSITYQD